MKRLVRAQRIRVPLSLVRISRTACLSTVPKLPRETTTLGDTVISRASIVHPANTQYLVSSLSLGAFTDRDLEKAFMMIDTNHDGKLSRTELRILFEDFTTSRGLSAEDLDKMVEHFISKWDDDKSGDISKEEFLSHALEIGNRVHPSIYQLAGCIFLCVLPFGILVPFEPQLVSSLGINAAQFGLAQGAMAGTIFLVNIPMTEVVERYGSKPLLVGSTALLGAGIGAISVVHTLEQLIMCRCLTGVAVAGLLASIMSATFTVQTPLNRTRSTAPFTMAQNSGIAMGPALGGFLSSVVSLETAFAGVGALYLVSALGNHIIYSEIYPAKPGKGRGIVGLFTTSFSTWGTLLRSSAEVRAVVASQMALWSAVGGTTMTMMPLLLVDDPLCFTAPNIGALMAGVALMTVVVTQPLAIFSDKFGRRNALAIGSLMMSSSMAMVPLAGTPALVSGAVAATALGQNLLAPSSSALLIDSVVKIDPAKVPQAMSLSRSAQNLGMLTGGVVFGALGTQFGFTVGYEVSSACVLGMGIYAYSRLPAPSV